MAAFVGALPLWSIACGDGKLKSDDFDRSCEVDSDCVVVVELGYCCSCEVVGINRDELEDYEEAADCGDCGISCASSSSPLCVVGTCEAQEDLLCAPGFEYACEREDCTNGAGIKRCNEDGVTYGDCICG